MAEGTWDIRIDWDGDGLYTGTGEDVSGRVAAGQPLSASHGRVQSRRLSPPAASRAALSLINTTGDYYPDNSGSPLFGQVKPGRKVRIQTTFNSTTYDIFTGQLFDLQFTADPFAPFCTLTCLDVINSLNRSNPTVNAVVGQRIDQCIGLLLDAVGWAAADRDLDRSSVTLPVWWADGTRSAWEEILMLLEVEGPPSIAYVAPDGLFNFKSRHHRLLDSRAKTSQNTFRNQSASEPAFSRFEFSPGWRDVINRVEIPVSPPTAAVKQAVFDSAEPHIINNATGATSLSFVSENPFPLNDVNYVPTITVNNTGSATPEDHITAVFGGAFPAYTVDLTLGITGFVIVSSWQIRAVPYSTSVQSVVIKEDTASQADYGIRTWRAQSPWHASKAQAQAVADLILNERKDPRQTAKIDIVNANTTRYTAGLSARISDLITVIDAESSVSDDFHVEHVAHSVGQGGKFHTVTLGLESAVTPLVAADEVFILGQGKLGTHKLGA